MQLLYVCNQVLQKWRDGKITDDEKEDLGKMLRRFILVSLAYRQKKESAGKKAVQDAIQMLISRFKL